MVFYSQVPSQGIDEVIHVNKSKHHLAQNNPSVPVSFYYFISYTAHPHTGKGQQTVEISKKEFCDSGSHVLPDDFQLALKG